MPPPDPSIPPHNPTHAPQPHAALRAIVTALRDATRADPALRADLAALLRELLADSPALPTAAAEQPAREPAATPPDAPAPPAPAEPERVVALPQPIRGPRRLQELKIGDSHAEVALHGDQVEGITPLDPPAPHEPPLVTIPPGARDHARDSSRDAPRIDLDRIERRARLKHDACLRAAAGEPTADLLDQLRALRHSDDFDAGLWMCSWLNADERARAARAAPCYAALANAAALARFLESHDQLRPDNALEHAFALIAQAQSAIRNFVDESRGQADADQFALFRWLRHQTGESCCRVLIHRHMRRDDIAPPEQGAQVAADLARELDAWKERVELPRRARNLQNKIKYERRKADDATDHDERLAHWRTIDAAVTELRALGVRTRDIAAHLVDAVPPPDFAPSPALAEVLDFMRRRDARDDEPDDRRTWSEDVPRARELLAGARLLVLCGNPNAPMREAYIEAFGLAACEWPEIKDHKFPISRVEGAIRAGTYDAVLLASGYTNHHHGEVAAVCREAGARLIRLAAERGYGVNQVARAALEQLGPRAARA